MNNNVTHYAAFIPISCFAPEILSEFIYSFFIDFNNIMANQIVSFFREDGYVLERKTDTFYRWKKGQIRNYFANIEEYSLGKTIHWEISSLLTSFLAFASLSIGYSLVIRIGLMASSIIIIICSKQFIQYIIGKWTCFTQDPQINLLINRAIPWVSVYHSYLQRTGKSDFYFIIAFFLFLMFSYLLFGVAYYIWIFAFYGSVPSCSQRGDGYLLYIEFIEIVSIVFFRTRITIYYLPKILTLLNIVFLYYTYSYFYPFTSEAVSLLFFLSFAIILLFFYFSEMPALDWNPFGLFTPATNNPRQAYIPILLSSFSIGFDLWTNFYAPAFRSENFNREEQTYIGDDAEAIQFDFSVEAIRGNNNPVPPPMEQEMENRGPPV